MQDGLALITEPSSPGEVLHAVNAVVVVAVIAQVNELFAALLLTALTTQPGQ